MRAPVLTLWKGVEAEMVVLDDVVQEAYTQKLRDQRIAYRRQPFNFLRGFSGPIKAKISERISSRDITIDSISSSNQQLSLAISTTALQDETQMTKEIVLKLDEIGIVMIAKDMAIISGKATKFETWLEFLVSLKQNYAKAQCRLTLTRWWHKRNLLRSSEREDQHLYDKSKSQWNQHLISNLDFLPSFF